MHPAKGVHNNEYYGKNEDIYMNRKLTAAILCCVMAALTACGGKGDKKAAEEKKATYTYYKIFDAAHPRDFRMSLRILWEMTLRSTTR